MVLKLSEVGWVRVRYVDVAAGLFIFERVLDIVEDLLELVEVVFQHRVVVACPAQHVDVFARVLHQVHEQLRQARVHLGRSAREELHDRVEELVTRGYCEFIVDREAVLRGGRQVFDQVLQEVRREVDGAAELSEDPDERDLGLLGLGVLEEVAHEREDALRFGEVRVGAEDELEGDGDVALLILTK